MRTPSTGREIVIEAEPGRTYVDRETGEPLEVVGDAGAARARRRPSCPGPSRTCACATGATSSRRRTSTTARTAVAAWRRSPPPLGSPASRASSHAPSRFSPQPSRSGCCWRSASRRAAAVARSSAETLETPPLTVGTGATLPSTTAYDPTDHHDDHDRHAAPTRGGAVDTGGGTGGAGDTGGDTTGGDTGGTTGHRRRRRPRRPVAAARQRRRSPPTRAAPSPNYQSFCDAEPGRLLRPRRRAGARRAREVISSFFCRRPALSGATGVVISVAE